jgi:hypothetical protein
VAFPMTSMKIDASGTPTGPKMRIGSTVASATAPPSASRVPRCPGRNQVWHPASPPTTGEQRQTEHALSEGQARCHLIGRLGVALAIGV